ncbi:unnamed protein product [Alternaria alternata]
MTASEPASRPVSIKGSTKEDQVFEFQDIQGGADFGFRLSWIDQVIQISGLEDVIRIVEHAFQEQIDEARDTIQCGSITFEVLGELYRPGDLVQAVVGSRDTVAVFLVNESFYQDNWGLTRVKSTFNWKMEFVATMGTQFTVVDLAEQLNGWTGVRARSLSELTYTPVSPVELSDRRQRGKRYVEFATGSVQYLAYSRASFYRHVRPSRPSYSSLASTSSSQLPSEDRVMIDVDRGALLEHHPCQGLSPIQDTASQHLVLAEEYKHLIRALVRFGNDASVEDIVENKRSDSIFLLHGPPSIGKTLTAEAVAEVLHRPLYYLTMGELGTTAEDMELRLSDVLELCSEWNAIIVLEEADVFLEQRSTSDLVRNSMVCVMLRLMEYHSGILFLTTNRVRNLDPAFESKITLALRYDHLTPEARAQIWSNLLKRISLQVAKNICPMVLEQHEFNG